MLKKLLILSILLTISISLSAQISWFKDGALRVDYYLGGNSETQRVYIDDMKREQFWGGPVKNLIDKFNYGNYRFRVLDAETGQLLFSKGFASLFQEWQTTAEAKKMDRSFSHTARFPFPSKPVIFKVDKREYKDGKFKNFFSHKIDPANYFILKESPAKAEVVEILKNGAPEKCVDIAFLAEGYTAAEMDKFVKDAKRFTNYILETEPFKKYKKHFNTYAVKSVSQESGTDIPGKRIYKNTALNTSYYTFDIARYLTTFDIKTLRDYAANAPYDAIYIIINTDKYGGGGFFNFYTACTSDHRLSPIVVTHEFGHGFAGLADEYYTSSVAYENYYNLKTEPWEPNITTMVNFESKWKKMVKKDTPVPTPREEKYAGVTGVFEGGGYVAKGVYSPAHDCRMKGNTAPGFCEACQKGIEKMILFTIDK